MPMVFVHERCLILRDVLSVMFRTHMMLAIQEVYMLGARRVHLILLDMADALCEAKCVKVSPMIFLCMIVA